MTTSKYVLRTAVHAAVPRGHYVDMYANQLTTGLQRVKLYCLLTGFNADRMRRYLEACGFTEIRIEFAKPSYRPLTSVTIYARPGPQVKLVEPPPIGAKRALPQFKAKPAPAPKKPEASSGSFAKNMKRAQEVRRQVNAALAPLSAKLGVKFSLGDVHSLADTHFAVRMSVAYIKE